MPLALLVIASNGENCAICASLFSSAEIDTVEPGMKINWVVLPYFSKKPASLATHSGAVLPLSLAVLKLIGAADVEGVIPIRIQKKNRIVRCRIELTLVNHFSAA